jgi:para-aminobenzoate synthetase component 1
MTSYLKTMSVRPLIEAIDTHLEPVDIFKLFRDTPYSCYLDSASHICKLGWMSDNSKYYSVIGIKPFLVFKSKNRKTNIIKGNKTSRLTGNPFTVLKDLFKEYHITGNDFPPPFYCGAVGYFGYDLRHFIERLSSNVEDDLFLPDCILCFYDPLIVYDHLRNKTFICSTGINPGAKKIIKEIKSKLRISGNEILRPSITLRTQDDILKSVTAQDDILKNVASQDDILKSVRFSSNFIKRDYFKAVTKAKEYIAAGDIFQVNLSQRFQTKYSNDTYSLYGNLRNVSPAPFMSYLNFKDLTVISSSPERFLKVSGRIVETRPMKGTRPRGRNKTEDLRLKNELLNSKKDKAELVMIVDLLRNDLGKVCLYDSVKVKNLRTIEGHPTVFQTTSTVGGKLVNSKSCIDLLKACFPGGSITGCPKVRSMEIIDELEPTARGVYTGALGFLTFNGNMDLSIVIRTIVITGKNNTFFQVGGGIVADSEPELEYEETLNKARAMMISLGTTYS